MLISASGHVKLADFGTCVKIGKVRLQRRLYIVLLLRKCFFFRTVWFGAAQPLEHQIISARKSYEAKEARVYMVVNAIGGQSESSSTKC